MDTQSANHLFDNLQFEPALDLEVANRIDEICDQFESDWKAGKKPDILDCLNVDTELPVDTLIIELIQIDIDYRRKSGERPTARDYLAVFPEHSDSILRLSETLNLIDHRKLEETVDGIRKYGRYELHEELGIGAFGVVWRAWDTRLKRWVALKLARVGDDAAIRRLFHREARALASLKHPNVLPIYDYGIEDDLAHIVFQLIEGSTFSTYLSQPTATLDKALNILLQVLSGLEYVHQQGVIHRDLKPANILIDRTGVPYIADFGLARHVGELSTIGEPGKQLGTIPYMSPEQLRGESVDCRTDVYSLGILLYRVLTGGRPFLGDEKEVRRQMLEQRPAHPSDVNEDVSRILGDICLKAIEKNPRHRYASAAEFRRDLSLALTGETLIVSQPGRVRRLFDDLPVSRRMMLVSGLAAGATATASASYLWWTGTGASASTTPVPINAISQDVNVRILTDPPGAQVVCHPINHRTGLPQPNKKIEVAGVSPVEVVLSSGDYLVVAYFNDENFNEVYRHVPYQGQSVQAQWKHFYFRQQNGLIEWRAVKIPERNPAESMVRIAGQERFTLLPEFPRQPIERYHIPDFYIDPYMVTQGQSRDYRPDFVHRDAFVIEGENYPSRNMESFDDFLGMAERFGKRLPVEMEYLFAATNAGTTKYPWGNEMPELAAQVTGELQPVGQPEFDKTLGEQPIYGLCSGVAEWVDSQFLGSVDPQAPPAISPLERNRFVIKGGSRRVILGELVVTEADRNPRQSEYMSRLEKFSGLGCRFARSVRPRLNPEDFLFQVREPG